jgi:hypothetical protein
MERGEGEDRVKAWYTSLHLHYGDVLVLIVVRQVRPEETLEGKSRVDRSEGWREDDKV